jgi:hypothetical protein
MNTLDMEKARREELRWLILRALYAAQPIGTTEIIIHTAIESSVPGTTEHEIRNQLDYLAERNLITVEKNRPFWFGKIKRYGIDVVEYTLECDPGIARPKPWC